MIKIHSGEIFQYAKENFNIELLLGGYHGKGEMIFSAVLILRFRTKNCGYHIMERRRTSGLSANAHLWTMEELILPYICSSKSTKLGGQKQ